MSFYDRYIIQYKQTKNSENETSTIAVWVNEERKEIVTRMVMTDPSTVSSMRLLTRKYTGDPNNHIMEWEAVIRDTGAVVKMRSYHHRI